MGIKLNVVRHTVQGEQVIVDILQCNPVTGAQEYSGIDEMHQALQEALDFADLRVHEMRMRGVEGYELRKYCTAQEWSKVVDILDFMAGRQNLDLIQRRWQSQMEENHALVAERAAQHTALCGED